MEEWNDGRMEKWKEGILEQWKDGRMEKWKENSTAQGIFLNPIPTCSKCSSPVKTSFISNAFIIAIDVRSVNEIIGLSENLKRSPWASLKFSGEIHSNSRYPFSKDSLRRPNDSFANQRGKRRNSKVMVSSSM